MTEEQWLDGAFAFPGMMLQFVQGKASDRKLRLFACASARAIWRYFPGERSRSVVFVSEKFADGQVTKTELKAARKKASGCERQTTHFNAMDAAKETGFLAAQEVGDLALGMSVERMILDGYSTATSSGAKLAKEVMCHQCTLLRDIFGNPFRPINLDRSCLTATAPGIAQAIYQERQFDRLPILADALEEAGVVQPDLLNHCRQPGEHVLGCWALDLVLGKE